MSHATSLRAMVSFMETRNFSRVQNFSMIFTAKSPLNKILDFMHQFHGNIFRDFERGKLRKCLQSLMIDQLTRSQSLRSRTSKAVLIWSMPAKLIPPLFWILLPFIFSILRVWLSCETNTFGSYTLLWKITFDRRHTVNTFFSIYSDPARCS